MKKEEGGIIAIIVVIIVIITAIIIGPWNGGENPFYNPVESLSHLPAPTEIPGDQVNATVVGNLTLSVTGSFYTMSPHRSPTTFSFGLDVIVNNTGNVGVNDFQVVKVTIFYEDGIAVYTFGTLPEGNSTVPPESVQTLEFENDGDMISVPDSLLGASCIFARVLVTFSVNTEVILTTPLTDIGHAIE